MADSRAHLDSYGRPIELAEARREVLYERATNQQQRQVIRDKLEEKYRELLRRGITAKVTLEFTVQDGFLQTEVHLSDQRTYRTVREE